MFHGALCFQVAGVVVSSERRTPSMLNRNRDDKCVMPEASCIEKLLHQKSF